MNQNDLEKTHKPCATCKIFKLKDKFADRKSTSDSLMYSCRECTNKRQDDNTKKRYALHPEKHAKSLKRNRDRMARIREDPNHIEHDNTKSVKKYTEDHPDRNRIHARISYHIRKGNLIKLPCAVCGSEKSEAHHEDYNKPYDII